MENVLTPTIAIGVRNPKTSVWIGRVFTGLVVTFLLVDALAKVLLLTPVLEASRQLGIAVEVIRPLGVLLALSTLLHLIPRTQFIGALLVTAYLGGATATHVHTGTPFWFAVMMGAILWIAYGLRSPRLRALVLSPQIQ